MRVQCGASNNTDAIAGKFLSCFQSKTSFLLILPLICNAYCLFACVDLLELFLFLCFPCDLNSHCSCPWTPELQCAVELREQINCENGNSLLFNTIIYSRQLAGPMGAITVTEMHRDTQVAYLGVDCGAKQKRRPLLVWSQLFSIVCLFWMLCAICESSHT